MQYSPKLKKAMEQIKKIIKENDIACAIVLVCPEGVGHTFAEYYMNIEPSFSALDYDGHNRIILKGKIDKHYNGNKQLQQDTLTHTAGMTEVLATETGKLAMKFFEINDFVKSELNATHEDLGGSSHTAQSN